jgi:hypothetical protein
MEDQYLLGNKADQILIQVQLGSAGTCHTTVLGEKNGKRVKLLDSDVSKDGSIPRSLLGISSDLEETELYIKTSADLGLLPATNLQEIIADKAAVKKYVDIQYKLDGGKNGLQTFAYQMEDCLIATDATLVEILKKLKLLADCQPGL